MGLTFRVFPVIIKDMKRVRLVYVAEGYGRIDSDDPSLPYGAGMTPVALYFAERAAKKRFGSNGAVVDLTRGKIHRIKSNQRRVQKPRARLSISGIWEFECLIGVPVGCGIVETETIKLLLRVTRARGSREYYEELSFKKKAKLQGAK